ncbi:MAG: Eco57I restriction-modification methylase domain-containing protein, partial [Anaerovoracaceae bacterium]
MPQKNILEALKSFDEKYYTLRYTATAISAFGVAMKQYLFDIKQAIANNSSEEHIKNITNAFLKKQLYADDTFAINTENNIDSTIRFEGKLYALIEAKRPSNKNEMVTSDNINKKALWEIVYYYLSQTRNITGAKVQRIRDVEIRRLIITDSIQWFLIDATDIENFCDGYLERHFYKYKNNLLNYANDNAKFYEDIGAHFAKSDITKKLPFVYFNMEVEFKSRKNWQYLYKILGREHLLKFGYKQLIKTHKLNDKFYQELLYIIGLKEIKENNTVVIKIDPTIHNSMADQVYRKYLDDKDEAEYTAIEKTFELLIIWLNRLLFIKLFEGQLIAFNSNEECYRILDNTKICDFQNLKDLFFNVLGKKVHERDDTDFYKQFHEIPYLNSSLFERQVIERDINISDLENTLVQKKSNSVLGNKGNHKTLLLEYVVDFLNSYSFSACSDEEHDEENKEIIDAAVLGLIFEKLNGYKDGSHYTPSFITEYMCKDTLELIVLRKINKSMSWECNSLYEVKEKIGFSLDIAKRINACINTIRICDPAVGSGHFLVSMLNRLIVIKKDLNVLFKYDSDERLFECNIVIIDDVLRILNGQGEDIIYNKLDFLSQQIQETIFNEKRLLIEDCLFGVDLNAKAVSICNLRLWVELLKNAYYKQGIMETLPNIDINIKCGNSLIHKLDFEVGKKVGTKQVLLDKSTKRLIKQYKEEVKRYKSIADKHEKSRVIQTIEQLKNELHATYVQLSIFDNSQLKDSQLYAGAFEWAFEFPEVLTEDGVFLGFDCIIGNPPYVQLQTMGVAADNLKLMQYTTYARMGDIYCLFYEQGYKLLNSDGLLSYITSNKWMRAGYGEALRNFLASRTNPMRLIDFAGHKIFDSATVDVNILTYAKGENNGNTLSCTIQENCLNNLSVYIEQNSFMRNFCANNSWLILPPIEQSIKEKIERIGTPLTEWNVKIYRGVLTGYNDAFIINSHVRDELIAADPKSAEIIRPILRGRDI